MLAQSQVSDLTLYHDSPLCTSLLKSAEFAKCPELPYGPSLHRGDCIVGHNAHSTIKHFR